MYANIFHEHMQYSVLVNEAQMPKYTERNLKKYNTCIIFGFIIFGFFVKTPRTPHNEKNIPRCRGSDETEHS